MEAKTFSKGFRNIYQVLRQRPDIGLHRLELSAILEVANPKPSSALLHGGLLQIVFAYKAKMKTQMKGRMRAYMHAYVRVHAYIHTKQKAFPRPGPLPGHACMSMYKYAYGLGRCEEHIFPEHRSKCEWDPGSRPWPGEAPLVAHVLLGAAPLRGRNLQGSSSLQLIKFRYLTINFPGRSCPLKDFHFLLFWKTVFEKVHPHGYECFVLLKVRLFLRGGESEMWMTSCFWVSCMRICACTCTSTRT